ncbi:MAG: RTX toxin [Acidobacteriota bacterium]
MRSIRTIALLVLFAGPLASQQWTQQGPAPGEDGQAENIPSAPISGAIETVVAHPSDADIVWIGAVNGGIFRTDNATAASPTWTAQTDSEASLSIGALELDPTDGTNNTLVAGIARTSSLGSLGGSRAGILRTTNGGTTWTQLAATGLVGANVVGIAARGSVIVAAVNSNDAGIACGTVGIYRSTNTGASFTQVSTAGGTGLPCGFAWDLASDPTDTTRLYAPATGLNASSDGLYRSTDTGATWTEVSDALAAFDTQLQDTPNNVEISVGNAGGANANVFAAVCDGGRLIGLYESQDAGDSWAAMDLPSTTEQGTAYGIHPGGQCGTHLSLRADPTNDDVVYIGGDRQPSNNENGSFVSQFPNSIGASNFGGRLFRVDGAQSLGSQATPITNCPSATTACGGSARTANDTAPHADSREMVFDANGDLLQTDDGGIYRHTNPNGTNGDWESVVGNLAVIEQHNVAYDSTSNILLSGNQDNSSTEQDATGDLTWSVPNTVSGDGGDVVVGEDDPLVGQSTRYMSSQFLLGLRRRIFNSSNTLLSDVSPSLTALGGAASVSGQFTTPVAINAEDPTRLVIGGSNGVYESFDRLSSVSLVAGTATPVVVNSFGAGGTIAYGIPGNEEVLYFASGSSVWVRTAAAPTAPTQRPTPGGTVLGVVIDPGDPTHAFAIDINQVFRTTNSGASWTDVTGNLFTSFSPFELASITFVPGTNDRIVVGSGRGVFVADDADFEDWSELGTDLPNVLVLELGYDTDDELLVAGTLGRGAWTLDLSTPGGGCDPNDAFEPDDGSGSASSITTGIAQNHKLCPAGDEDWVTFTLVAESEVTLTTSSSNPDDPRLTLFDNSLVQLEQNDDGAANGRDALIDRTCASDPLAAGTYFVRADEASGAAEIDSYDLTYNLVNVCSSCASQVTIANQTISGSQSETAENVTLGSNLEVTGTGSLTVRVSNRVTFESGTSISGTLRVDTDPANCP